MPNEVDKDLDCGDARYGGVDDGVKVIDSEEEG